MSKSVYCFGGGEADGNSKMEELLGGEGANLAEMCLIRLPVPAGFTITTEACNNFNVHGQAYMRELRTEIDAAIRKTGDVMGAAFGDARNPLLVSCRPSTRFSIPGVMNTVPNIGLNTTTLKGLIDKTRNERLAWDTYRRFVQKYGALVLDIKPQPETWTDPFEEITLDLKYKRGIKKDTQLTVKDLQELVNRFKKTIEERKGRTFPDDPMEQMWIAIAAVFSSWNSRSAIAYRQQHGYPHDWGTAINICSMVFGNMGEDSGTGIALTRNPFTGEDILCGDYIVNATAEDWMGSNGTAKRIAELEKELPGVYKQLVDMKSRLEGHYRNVLEFDFTVQNGAVYLHSSRIVVRRLRASAAVTIAVDMVANGLIDKETAVFRVDHKASGELLQPQFDEYASRELLARGLPGSAGVAVGEIALTSREALQRAEQGEKVVLALKAVSRSDFDGIAAAEGVVEVLGGMTSHGALIGRALGKPAVTGASMIEIDLPRHLVCVGERVLGPHDAISIDGGTGEIFVGGVPVVPVSPDGALKTFLEWEDIYRPRGRPAPAYRGDKPYAFVSYAHGDRQYVLTELTRLAMKGFRLWYDEGIQPGSHWTDEIADVLHECAVVVVFLSNAAVQSEHVKRETFHALANKKPVLPVQFEECEIPARLRFVLADTQMILRHRMTEEDYQHKLEDHLKSAGIGRAV
jgi:pyruvate, orthophosphate dikinase